MGVHPPIEDRIRKLEKQMVTASQRIDARSSESVEHGKRLNELERINHTRRCGECHTSIPQDIPCGESWKYHDVHCSRFKHPRGVPPPVMPPLGRCCVGRDLRCPCCGKRLR